MNLHLIPRATIICRLAAALFVILVAAFAGALRVGIAAPASASGDPPDVVINRWTAAGSAGDVDRALALCADNVSFTLQYTLNGVIVPMGRWGLAFQRTQMTAPAAQGARSRLISTEVKGTTVVARVEATAPGYTALGVSRVLNTTTMEVVDGKITSVLIEWDMSDAETVKFLTAARVYPPAAPAAPNTGNGLLQEQPAIEWGWLLAGATLMALGGLALACDRVRRT